MLTRSIILGHVRYQPEGSEKKRSISRVRWWKMSEDLILSSQVQIRNKPSCLNDRKCSDWSATADEIRDVTGRALEMLSGYRREHKRT